MILTNDPSLTAWGWAILDANGKVVASGAIQTKPNPKKSKIRKGDDNIRRIKEITSVLIKHTENYKIELIISEQPHGSQSATAAIMIGFCTAILQTLSDCFEIPLEWYSEADCKKAISGKRSVGKDEMVEIAKQHFDLKWRNTKWIDQAVADSLAVFYAASFQSEHIKMLKKATKMKRNIRP